MLGTPGETGRDQSSIPISDTPGHLVLDRGLPRTHLADPSRALESETLVQPFGRPVRLSDPENDLGEVLAFRPIFNCADERSPHTTASKTGINPERCQRYRAAEFPGAGAHHANHMAVDLGHEPGPTGEALTPTCLGIADLALVG